MKCPKCYAETIEGGNFCGECGFNLDAPQPDETESIPQARPPQPIYPSMAKNPAPREKRRVFVPILCVLLGIAVGAGVFGFLQLQEREDIYSPAPAIMLTVGQQTQFGGYTWRVLDVQGDRALLLSEYVIGHRVYHHTTNELVTWEQSELRHWLNNEFFNSFSTSDRVRIAQTYVVNNNNPWFDTPGGNNTHDRIFLLSLEEVVRHFGDSGQLANGLQGMLWIRDEFNDARIARSAVAWDTHWGSFSPGDPSWWWLRSPGIYGFRATDVSFVGFVNVIGLNVTYAGGGVRPALWLYL